MSKEKVKICDLDLSADYKKLLAYLVKPRTIADVAAFANKGYTGMSQVLLIWEARGWIQKTRSRGGKVIYSLNTANVRL